MEQHSNDSWIDICQTALKGRDHFVALVGNFFRKQMIAEVSVQEVPVERCYPAFIKIVKLVHGNKFTIPVKLIGECFRCSRIWQTTVGAEILSTRADPKTCLC